MYYKEDWQALEDLGVLVLSLSLPSTTEINTLNYSWSARYNRNCGTEIVPTVVCPGQLGHCDLAILGTMKDHDVED